MVQLECQEQRQVVRQPDVSPWTVYLDEESDVS